MEYTHIFEKYRFSTDKAEKFGFKEKSGQYVYKTEEYGGVYLVFTIDPAKKTFSVHAVDNEFDEIYRMFEVGGAGSFANEPAPPTSNIRYISSNSLSTA